MMTMSPAQVRTPCPYHYHNPHGKLLVHFLALLCMSWEAWLSNHPTIAGPCCPLHSCTYCLPLPLPLWGCSWQPSPLCCLLPTIHSLLCMTASLMSEGWMVQCKLYNEFCPFVGEWSCLFYQWSSTVAICSVTFVWLEVDGIWSVKAWLVDVTLAGMSCDWLSACCHGDMVCLAFRMP